MTYLIKTFRGHTYSTSYEQARQLASDMVDVLTDSGFIETCQWAKVINLDEDSWKVIYNQDGTRKETPWLEAHLR